jgi:hypothetical protein
MALDEYWSCEYTHEVSGSIQDHTFLKKRQTKGPFECVSSRKVLVGLIRHGHVADKIESVSKSENTMLETLG